MTHIPRSARNPEIQALTAALAEPFDPQEVKFKPQIVKNNRCLAMAYIDARLIQDRLDEVLGVENWQDSYQILPDGSVICRLRLKLGDRWITKTDVGSPSEQSDGGDRMKAAFSDALKRAAVKFGIGRYLYRLPAQWVEYDPVKKQIVQVPKLPAFAIPQKRNSQPPSAVANVSHSLPSDSHARGMNQSMGMNQSSSCRSSDAQPTAAPASRWPQSGAELHRRLQNYDAQLADQHLCPRGTLLAHVLEAGVKAGYSANIGDWDGAAIRLAVDTVREFEKTLRKSAEKTTEVSNAA
ncbi:MAG: Rad52/Rad22 family DNA repair protein [Gemmataceae bacterium]|nr:Rad52/Rad22 family DNA repair protein [Gemmata sp.]MDW8199305.1 Rad52/Rad22 family DNA repair protein [Gemmataceae bacterium]